MIKREEIMKVCFHLYGEQNKPDQLLKRSGDWYCYIYNKYIKNVKDCMRNKCPHYYSIEDREIDNL